MVSNTLVGVKGRSSNLGATPAGEGVDLHFEPIGKRSLLDGETLSLTLAKAKVDYERIVEWTVANQAQSKDGEASNEDVWDVLHFRNPFTFPMTTAPAMVTEKGQFNGQRTCYWANAGEETSLPHHPVAERAHPQPGAGGEGEKAGRACRGGQDRAQLLSQADRAGRVRP